MYTNIYAHKIISSAFINTWAYTEKCLKVYCKTFKDNDYIKGVEINMGCKICICVTFF